ncbi:hypothetical protein [Kribbella deserti]|uniref:Integrase catalytic domain-containing protein n=1 Tax=Kribbella deserti TaxID=1926257 RepID=A0ABV6QXN2_9ACTN
MGIKIIPYRPAAPEAKGLVALANGYLETSFLPGRCFTSTADFNAQLTGWLALTNLRPPVAPVVGWRSPSDSTR